jgi:exodeoxyribonuclease VII small subunit
MPDDRYTFEQARTRLAEIVTEVRKKDTSLEKSLDLLEEGVRLANVCTELVERADDGPKEGPLEAEEVEARDEDPAEMPEADEEASQEPA